jgi:hypothetical protein
VARASFSPVAPSVTGDVSHPPLVYVLDADGRIAFAATAGGTEALVDLLGRV